MATPINTKTMPGDNMNPDDIETAAGQIRGVGTNVSTTGGDVVTAWSGLSNGYHAPEQETLFGAIKPVTTLSGDFASDLDKVATALETFAGDVRTIQAAVKQIRADAKTFLAGIHNGKVSVVRTETYSGGYGVGGATMYTEDVDWNSDEDTVEQNNKLIRRTNDQQEQLWAAERKCANAIRDVYGAKHIAAMSQSNPGGYGVDQIPDNASGLPWGNTVDVKESCGQKVADGVVIDGIVNGLGGLIGFHYTQESALTPESMGFSWSTLGNTWKGLAQLGTGIVAGPVAPALSFLPGPVGKWFGDSTEADIGFVPSLVGIDVFKHDPSKPWYNDWNGGWLDNWKNDPARTAGSTGFNVLTFAIPGPKGLGALTKGSKAARAAEDAGEAGDAVRAADGAGDLAGLGGKGVDLSKISKVPESEITNLGKDVTDLGDGLNGLDKTDIDIPNVPDHQIGTDHPTTGDHAPGDAPEPRDPDTTGQPDSTPSHPDTTGHPAAHGGHTPDGTKPSPAHPGTPYDPDKPAPETVPAKEAPTHYTPHDVQKALDNSPVDEHGEHVDPRTGEPLLLERADGARGWEMRWDPKAHEWVAQNMGAGYETGLPARGEPNSFGYNEHGHRMPYANQRPNYAPTQVKDVWDAADRDGDGVVTVRDRDGHPVEIKWDGKSSREGVWDMGHLPGAEYAKLRHEYLSHEISYDEFIKEYQDPGNYEVQDPSRNRAHLDEVP